MKTKEMKLRNEILPIPPSLHNGVHNGQKNKATKKKKTINFLIIAFRIIVGDDLSR